MTSPRRSTSPSDSLPSSTRPPASPSSRRPRPRWRPSGPTTTLTSPISSSTSGPTSGPWRPAPRPRRARSTGPFRSAHTPRTGDHVPGSRLWATGRGFAPGAVIDGANVLDVAPTVLDLLAVPVPASVDGRSLRLDAITTGIAANDERLRRRDRGRRSEVRGRR